MKKRPSEFEVVKHRVETIARVIGRATDTDDFSDPSDTAWLLLSD